MQSEWRKDITEEGEIYVRHDGVNLYAIMLETEGYRYYVSRWDIYKGMVYDYGMFYRLQQAMDMIESKIRGEC